MRNKKTAKGLLNYVKSSFSTLPWRTKKEPKKPETELVVRFDMSKPRTTRPLFPLSKTGKPTKYILENCGKEPSTDKQNYCSKCGRFSLPKKLSRSQQLVLNELENNCTCSPPLAAVEDLLADTDRYDDLKLAYNDLSEKEEFEVLAAFAEWGFQYG